MRYLQIAWLSLLSIGVGLVYVDVLYRVLLEIQGIPALTALGGCSDPAGVDFNVELAVQGSLGRAQPHQPGCAKRRSDIVKACTHKGDNNGKSLGKDQRQRQRNGHVRQRAVQQRRFLRAVSCGRGGPTRHRRGRFHPGHLRPVGDGWVRSGRAQPVSSAQRGGHRRIRRRRPPAQSGHSPQRPGHRRRRERYRRLAARPRRGAERPDRRHGFLHGRARGLAGGRQQP